MMLQKVEIDCGLRYQGGTVQQQELLWVPELLMKPDEDDNLSEAPQLHGEPGQHWWSPRQDAGGRRLGHGLCGCWPLSGAKKKWPFPRMAEGHMCCQHKQPQDCCGCLPEWCATFSWCSLANPQLQCLYRVSRQVGPLPVSTKEQLAVVAFTSDILQGLEEFSPLTISTFFWILSLARPALVLSLPVPWQWLFAFLSEFLAPFLTSTFTCGLLEAVRLIFWQNSYYPCEVF